MTNQANVDVGCLFAAEYVDEAEVPANLAVHPGDVVRPKVVHYYLDTGKTPDVVKQFTILLNDNRVATVRGHGLKVVEASSTDAVSYAVVMDMGTKEFIVALFKVNQVIGVFCGEMASAPNGAQPTQRSA